jgi:hypothetical protein
LLLSFLGLHLAAMQRRMALLDYFGSQKKRKVMKSQEANMINVESVIGAGSLIMGALKAGATSESNRTAMAASKSGKKVSHATMPRMTM